MINQTINTDIRISTSKRTQRHFQLHSGIIVLDVRRLHAQRLKGAGTFHALVSALHALVLFFIKSNIKLPLS
jgi:hypothetical protein